MNFTERTNFYKKIGFKSIDQVLADADQELEVISNLEKKEEFELQYSKFKEKHNRIFIFNDLDNTDLSPYSAFIDPKQELFANSDGYFYIHDKRVIAEKYKSLSEKNANSTYVSLRGVSFENNSTNYAWSHQSKRKVGLYISIDGNAIWTRFTSQKKNFWGWNRYSTVYEAAFKLNGGFHHYYTTPTGVRYVDRNNMWFQISTGEQSGNYSMVLGHLHTENPIPSACRFKTEGNMEIWSRGVSYNDRGFAKVSLCN